MINRRSASVEFSRLITPKSQKGEPSEQDIPMRQERGKLGHDIPEAAIFQVLLNLFLVAAWGTFVRSDEIAAPALMIPRKRGVTRFRRRLSTNAFRGE